MAQLDNEELHASKATTTTLDIETEIKSGKEPALMHRSLVSSPQKVISASGSYLTLDDGREILDACGGAAVAIIGHGNEEVLQATLTQMRQVSYIHTIAYTTSSADDLASFILEVPKGGFQHGLVKAFFCGSGSEANDSAMKLARQYFYEKGEPQRKYFVARRGAYHGNSVATMSISSNLARKVPFKNIMLTNASHVSPAFAYHYQLDSESEASYVNRLIKELDTEFQRLGPENIISFIAEPIVGATSGCVPSPSGYFPAVKKLCEKYGILLHLDEIMCGMGRTGTYFACEQDQVVPDIMTVGKGLGGGYAPIAAVLVSGKVIDVLKAGSKSFNNGFTYQAHPVSCATTLAVQKIIRREKLVERCAKIGPLLQQLLVEAFAGCKYVGDIRGRGLFWAVEFVKDKSTKESFPVELGFAYNVQKSAFELGVAVYPGNSIDGVKGDHVLLAPPYTISDEDLKTAVRVLREAYGIMEGRVELAGAL